MLILKHFLVFRQDGDVTICQTPNHRLDTFFKGTQAAWVNMILNNIHNNEAHTQDINVLVRVIVDFVLYAETFCFAFWSNESFFLTVFFKYILCYLVIWCYLVILWGTYILLAMPLKKYIFKVVS